MSVEGPAVFEEGPTVDQVRPLVRRYLPEDETENFLEQSFNDRAVIIRMRPEHWLTVDYSKIGF